MGKSTMMISALMLAGATTAAEYSWVYREDVGTAVTNLALWTEGANWGGTAPSAASDVARFPSMAGTRYVRLPDALSVAKILGSYTSGLPATAPVLISDGMVSGSSAINGVRFYADSVSGSGLEFSAAEICADLKTTGWTLINMYDVAHRLDKYATAAGETRTNPFATGNFKFSWGSLNMYAPESTPTNVVGQWRQRSGSAFLARVSAFRHALPVGTLVHGTGIAEGTYLRRVFDDVTIELSAPVTADVDANAVTFDAFSPSVTQTIPSLQNNSGGTGMGINLMMHAPTDSLRLSLEAINTQEAEFCFDCKSGFYPGTMVFKRITTSLPKVMLGNCRFEFENPASGTAGFAGTLRMRGSAKTARLVAPSGVDVSIGALTTLNGKLVKEGSGELTTKLTGTVSDNSGMLVVADGTLALAGDELMRVKTLAVSNGATLKLPAGGLKVDRFVFEAGAVLDGDGYLELPGVQDLSGLVFRGASAVSVAGGSGTVYADTPPTNVVGNPAFWVDVSKESSMILTNVDNVTRVLRIDDVRGANYGYAITNGTRWPQLVTGEINGRKHIYFKAVSDADKAGAYDLVWNQKLRHIRAVFQVHSAHDGGGQILGITPQFRHEIGDRGPFMRPAGSGWAAAMIWTEANNAVSAGRFFVNGEERTKNQGLAYGSMSYSKTRYSPQLWEMHPVYSANGDDICGAAADTFAWDAWTGDRNGNKRLFECIVYTNALTDAERVQVAGYLMKKWMNAEVDYASYEKNGYGTLNAAGSPAVYVAAGETGWADGVTGAGALAKSGDGTFVMPGFSDANADIHVRGGTLSLRSQRLTAETLPEGAIFHVDASAASTLTTNREGEVTYVTKWKSVTSSGQTLSQHTTDTTNKPMLTANGPSGKPCVDFGDWRNLDFNARATLTKQSPALKVATAKQDAAQTVFAVMSGRKGGGSLVPTLGNGLNDMYGLYRTSSGTTSSPILGNTTGYNAAATSSEVGTGLTFGKLNGTYVNLKGTGFTGNWDLVSLVNRFPFGYSGLGGDHYTCTIGGQEIAEYILYPQGLSMKKVARVEAYLREKWFGVTTPGFEPMTAKDVTVDAGATLELTGGALTAKSISGAGRIDGAVTLAADAELVVKVASDGSVPLTTVTGAVGLANGCLVRLAGTTSALKAGVYPILSAAGLSAGDLAKFRLEDPGLRKFVALGFENGCLVLKVTSPGLMLIIR